MIILTDTQPQQFDPATLDYEKAVGYIPKPVIGADNYDDAILNLIEDNDFWQNSARYVGPKPAPGDGFTAGMTAIKNSFAPISKLKECLARHVRGVIGREPQFEIVMQGDKEGKPSPLAVEADTLQGEVWDERGEHTIAERFVRRLRATGKAYLRYDVPPGLLAQGIDRATGEETSGIAASTWQDAYRMFYLELAPRGSAYIHTDPATMRQTAFYSYEEARPSDPKNTRKCVQMSWLDDNRITKIKVVRDDNTSDEWDLDTGGRLLLVEAEMDPLLTPDLLRLQDILSSITTMIKINADIAGFPEVTGVDISPPGEVIDDPDNPGNKIIKAVAVESGPRTMKFFHSYQEMGENGPAMDEHNKPIVRRGTLQYREPVSSEPLRDDAEMFERQIFRAMSQEHMVARRSSSVSAEALIAMRADYETSLLETKPHVEKALRNVFHARLCAAAYLAGDTKALNEFEAARVRVEANLDAGPLSPAERSDILTRYEKRLLSRETAMVLTGIEDVEAELDKIKADELAEFSDGYPSREVEDGAEEETEL